MCSLFSNLGFGFCKSKITSDYMLWSGQGVPEIYLEHLTYHMELKIELTYICPDAPYRPSNPSFVTPCK